MNRRGFSAVELIIVIVIMSILLVLGVVNLRGSQANARDVERTQDVKNIAQHLESYYTSGTGQVLGSYPTIDLINNEVDYLPDIDTENIKAPDQTNSSLKAASDTSSPPNSPTLNKDTYIYQPLKSDGTLCTINTDECTNFVLYYMSETSNPLCDNNNVCTIKSRSQ